MDQLLFFFTSLSKELEEKTVLNYSLKEGGKEGFLSGFPLAHCIDLRIVAIFLASISQVNLDL